MIGMVILMVILAILAFCVGLLLRGLAVVRSYKREADHALSYALRDTDTQDLEALFAETRRRYEAHADEYDVEEIFSDEYRAIFMDIREDESYKKVRHILNALRESHEFNNMAFCFYDRERERCVYVVDGDTEERVFYPGQWISDLYDDMCTDEEMDRIAGSKYRVALSYGDVSGWTATDANLIYDTAGSPIGYSISEMDMSAVYREIHWIFLAGAPILLFIIVFLPSLVGRTITLSIVKPITEISDAAERYTQMDVEELLKGQNVFEGITVRRKNEILMLLDTLKTMSTSITESIYAVRSMTADRERMTAELSIAERIQQALLPDVTSEFADAEEFDIFAMMRPAKEVGGDYYDAFMVDDHTLAFLVADVSDKGVGASLFMALSKEVLRVRSIFGGTPAKICADVDRWLSRRNDIGMFVTAWFGFLDLDNGHVTACNAGHSFPMICRCRERDKGFVEETSAHGAPLAFWPGLEYPEVEFDIAPGDRIFLYTDGVNEAQGADRDLFGAARMEAVLNSHLDEDNEAICRAMEQAVDAHVGDSPQFDDMTMVMVTYHGKKAKEKEQELETEKG